jgi:hypothetical protein
MECVQWPGSYRSWHHSHVHNSQQSEALLHGEEEAVRGRPLIEMEIHGNGSRNRCSLESSPPQTIHPHEMKIQERP